MDAKGAEAFHDHYGIRQCIRCNKTLTGVIHHYYCDKCWARNQLGIICRYVDGLFFRAKRVRR